MANQYPDGGNSSVIIGEGGQIDDPHRYGSSGVSRPRLECKRNL